MANIIAAGIGNFTTAATWQTVDSVSELDSEASNSAISTSTLDSSTFVLPAVALDAVCLKIAARASSPSGTFTVTLRNSTTSTDARSVTINVSDLDASGLGWQTFKFASSVTPNGTDSYLIRVVCSATGSQVTLYRNATTNNWSRKLRTTTTQAPASGNHIIISNELTGAGTKNTITVTLDNTATTSFGPTVSGGPPQGIVVSGGGTFNLGTSASTSYYLKWKGIFLVCGGGTCNWGTSGTPLDSSSTLVLEMDCASNVDSGISVNNGGTWKEYGAVKTTTATLMTADKAIADTVIALASTSGWANGDMLAFSSTTQTRTQAETKNVSTVDSSIQVTLSAGLTNAHSGTSPTQCSVINLTRNIKVRGIDTTHQGYFVAIGTAVVIMSYSEHYQLGSSTGNKHGMEAQTTTGSFSATGCSFHDATVDQSIGFYINGSPTNNVSLDHCVFWNNNNGHLQIDALTNTNWSFTNNTCIGTARGSSSGITLTDVGGVFTGNLVSSSVGIGIVYNGTDTTGTFSNNTACNNGSDGVRFNTPISPGVNSGTFSFITCWRNTSNGITFQSTAVQTGLVSATTFGNGAANIFLNSFSNEVLFDSCTLAGDSTFATPIGLRIINSVSATNIYLFNCSFGPSTGIYVAHSTVDIAAGVNGFSTFVQIYANNSTFTAAKTVASNTGGAWDTSTSGPVLIFNSYIRCMNFNTAGNHLTITPMGINSIDTGIYNTASPSERLTPSASSSYKLQSANRQYPVDNGSTKTISVYIRKSVATDPSGFDYAGSAPRLIVKRSNALGITADTVLATSVAANGTWEQLIGTTAAASEDGAFEVYVDCDGTSGAWVNVDDWG